MERPPLDVAAILDRGVIDICFQPIVSLKARTVVGVEALARPRDARRGTPVPPAAFFDAAAREGLAVEADRACRAAALRAFGQLALPDTALLFLNLDSEILGAGTAGSDALDDAVHAAGINPWRVAIELVESRVGEPRLLADFSRRHRERGYLIVIDDFGLAHSNFERLIDVRPDIIKIDRGIIDGVEADHYRRSIVRSIVELARDTGALSLAEGVENEAQITTCALLGAELFQGYALAAPCPEPSVVSAEVARRIDAGIQAVQQEAARKLDEKRRTVARYKEVATRVTAEVRTALLRCGVPGAENALDALVDGFHGIGCAYLLDSRGIQVTTTHVSTAAARRPRHVLFQPASPGADHSLKGYFHDMRGRSEYFTDPYISLATGNMCTTLATRIIAGPDTEYILCVDFE